MSCRIGRLAPGFTTSQYQALLSAVGELGQLTDTPTPYINAIYACTKLLDQTLTNAGARLRMDPIDIADSVA